jgi:hypothetical protein
MYVGGSYAVPTYIPYGMSLSEKLKEQLKIFPAQLTCRYTYTVDIQFEQPQKNSTVP